MSREGPVSPVTVNVLMKKESPEQTACTVISGPSLFVYEIGPFWHAATQIACCNILLVN